MTKWAPNLCDCLINSHFTKPTMSTGWGHKLQGSYPCGNCTICQFMKSSDCFENSKLYNYMNCKTRFVINCIIWTCSKIYIGQTSQELRKGIHKHVSTITLVDGDHRQGKKLSSVAENFHKQHKRKPGGLRVLGLETVTTGLWGRDSIKLLLQK